MISTLGTVEDDALALGDAMSTRLDTVAASWAGPRKDSALAASRAYLDEFRVAPGAIAQARVLLSALQVAADDIAASMQRHENTMASAASARAAGIEVNPEIELVGWLRGSARRAGCGCSALEAVAEQVLRRGCNRWVPAGRNRHVCTHRLCPRRRADAP